MTGKAYYLTTLDAWRRHSSRVTTSHFVVLEPGADIAALSGSRNQKLESNATDKTIGALSILLLVEADEGEHLALEADSNVTPLPHPLAQKPIPEAVQAALASYGVARAATTFDVAEVLGQIHPLLRHRVF